MTERLDRAGRLVAVQRRLHQIAEWRLARLNLDEAERLADEREMVGRLNGEEALAALFVDAVAKRLTRLGREVDTIRREQAVEGQRVTEEGLRLKRTERLAERLAVEDRRGAERRFLEEAGERDAGRDASSS